MEIGEYEILVEDEAGQVERAAQMHSRLGFHHGWLCSVAA